MRTKYIISGFLYFFSLFLFIAPKFNKFMLKMLSIISTPKKARRGDWGTKHFGHRRIRIWDYLNNNNNIYIYIYIYIYAIFIFLFSHIILFLNLVNILEI